MRWFSRSWFRSPPPPEQKAVSPTVAAYVYTPGSRTSGIYRHNGITFEQAAREGYGKNVIAYRAVDEVATAISSVPWLAYRKSKARQEMERTEVPMPSLFVRPNPYQSWTDILYGLVSYYLISGNGYIEAIAPSVSTPPLQLYLHRPDTIRPMPGEVGLAAYGLVTSSGVKPLWPVNPVDGQSNMRLIKTFHPLEPWVGMSPIEAAALGLDVHNDANIWNANLLRRGASTDLAIVAEQPMPDTSYTRLRDQLEQEASGARNVKGFTLIDGLGDKYHFEKISFSPRDMSWLEAKNTSAHEVALAMGGSTMPFLLGLSGTMTYSNQKEARLAFWLTFVLPLLRKIRDEINVWLMPRFGEGLELDVDLDEIPALEPQREARWDRIEKSTMLSINQKLELLGFDTVQVPGADIPLALLPYAMAGATEQEEPQAEEETKGRAFEAELVASGIAPAFAKQMRDATFPHSKPPVVGGNGTVH